MNERDQAYRISAIIAAAMIAGQIIFAAVSWYLHNMGGQEPTETIPILVPIWGAMAFGGVMAAFFTRNRLASVDPHAEVNVAAVQTSVIVMWALLEGPGLLGIVLYFLNGNPNVLYAALGYVLASAIFFFPRREWFGATAGRGR